jgi:hypothetical protein
MTSAVRDASAATALCLALGGCVAVGGYYDTDAGYDTDVTVGYSPGYLEPYGYEVGGWGDNYRLGPGRGGDRRSPQPAHAYQAAPAARAAPSIPGGSRNGAERSQR